MTYSDSFINSAALFFFFFCKRQHVQINNSYLYLLLITLSGYNSFSEFPPLSCKDQIQICFITINMGQNCACLPERTQGKSWSIWRQSVRSHPRQGWRRTACMWYPAGAEEPVWLLLLSCEIQRRRDENMETRLINKSHVSDIAILKTAVISALQVLIK